MGIGVEVRVGGLKCVRARVNVATRRMFVENLYDSNRGGHE